MDKKVMRKIFIRIAAAALVMTIVTAFASCGLGGENESPPSSGAGSGNVSQDKVIGDGRAVRTARVNPPKHDEIAISRAAAAKMIVLAMHGNDEIDKINETGGDAVAVEENAWYTRYVNAAARMKYMVGGEDGISPEKPLTVYEAQVLLDRLNPNNKTQIKITDENRDLPISYALWSELFVNTLKELAGEKTIEQKFGLREVTLVVLATQANVSSLPEWSAVTDKGAFFAGGIDLEPYIDRRTGFFMKDNEIAFLTEVAENEPVIEGALVAPLEDGFVGVFAGGASRTYKLVNSDDAELESVFVADVRLTEAGAELIKTGFDEVKSEVKRVTESFVELKDRRFDLQTDIPVYQIADGKPVYKDKTALIAGMSNVSVFAEEDVARAVIIYDKPKISKIRVLICSSDYSMTVHKAVTVSSESGFTVESASASESFTGGEAVTFDKESAGKFFADGAERVYITPNEGGLLSISSITRGGEIPKYKGVIEIAREGEAFVIVNELGFEEYLYSVVAGQIPEALGETAMRAQAVVSRSGAVSEFYANRYARYGANVDDTSRSQLYNVKAETAMSTRAVNETASEVLTFDGEVIRPTFFLATGGHTANRGETWQKAGGTAFPSDTPEYLSAALQVKGIESGADGGFGDLSQEENAERFFKSRDIGGYEKDVSWFRWSVSMTKGEVEVSINAAVKARYVQNPSQCLTLVNGSYEQRPIEGIGELVGMEVVKRGAGGNIMELKVIGTGGEFLFKTENNIRALIRPVGQGAEASPVLLVRGDGTKIENYHTMPSAFYVFDILRGENGEITAVNFYGGGNGHGVGMSQCGAKALSDEGMGYVEILTHFYRGASVGRG